MSTIRLRAARDVPHPADRVWAIVSNYERDPEWRQGVETMNPSTPGTVEPGVTTDEHMRFAGRRYRNPGRVLSVDPGRSFSWAGPRATGSRTVRRDRSEACRVELTLDVEPAGSERVMAPILGRMLARQLERDIDRLVALVEREAAPARAAG